MKRLLMIRHAIAEDGAPLGDDARALTDKGRRRCARHAEKIAERIRLSGIVTSPKVRAVQTAEIFAAALGLERVLVRAELAQGAKAIEALARELGGGWGLIGHRPSLDEAAARLLGLPKGSLHLPKAAVLSLRWPEASFDWLWAPGQRRLRTLKEALGR